MENWDFGLKTDSNRSVGILYVTFLIVGCMRYGGNRECKRLLNLSIGIHLIIVYAIIVKF